MNNADKPKKSAHQVWREAKKAGLNNTEMKLLFKSEGIIIPKKQLKTKEQVIQEAYEVLNIPFNENILYDGWTKIKPGQFYSKYDDLDLLKLTAHVHSIRPKHLRGIENNNGWIKIENVDDLPKTSGNYLVFTADSKIETIYVDGDISSMKHTSQNWISHFTHFQPIKTPNPPLY